MSFSRRRTPTAPTRPLKSKQNARLPSRLPTRNSRKSSRRCGHLEPFRKQNLIEPWHDRKIGAGDEFEKLISKHIDEADIILLLVSIDFINSKYCNEIELKRALERHMEGNAIVIPIIARACHWHESAFGKLLAAPKDGTPILSMPNLDEALLKVVTAIADEAKKLQEKHNK
jgi:hypothetical protein